MIVVCDTGPLRYLCELEVIDVLPRLYTSVLTTPCVVEELSQPDFPLIVRGWASSRPPWLLVESPAHIRFDDILDTGEAASLSLAIERRADAILIDEQFGRRIARANGIRVTGTLGVLLDAGVRDWIDLPGCLDRLTRATSFYSTPELIEQVRAEFARRRAE